MQAQQACRLLDNRERSLTWTSRPDQSSTDGMLSTLCRSAASCYKAVSRGVHSRLASIDAAEWTRPMPMNQLQPHLDRAVRLDVVRRLRQREHTLASVLSIQECLHSACQRHA